MLSRISRVLLVVVTIALLTSPAWATPLAPIAVTGYNRDVLFGPDGGVGGGWAAAQDSGTVGFAMAGTLMSNGVAQPYGLPVGVFPSLLDPTHMYQIAPNGAGGTTEFDNVFYMTNSSTATVNVTLATPAKYDLIGVLTTSGNGNANPKTATLWYSDGTSSAAQTWYSYDWTGNSSTNTGKAGYNQIAVTNFYRANGANGTSGGFNVTDGGYNDKALFEMLFTADPTKNLSYIALTNGTGGYCSIFAVSGDAVGTPEPGTLTLLAAGLIGLLCYAWRKRR